MSRRRLAGAGAALLVAGTLLATPAKTRPAEESLRQTVQRGLQLMQAGETEQAREVFEEVVRQHPDHGTARFQLGRLALEQGDLAAARTHLEIATSSDPQRLYLAWNLLGRVQLLERDAQGAGRSFSASLEAAPRFAPSLLGRARASLWLGTIDAARTDLAAALELDSAPAETPLLAAELAIYDGSSSEARRLLEPIAADDEAGPTAAAARMLLLALGSAPQDRDRLLLLVGRDLALADGYLALGIQRLAADDATGAAAPLRIALELDDGNPMAARFLERAIGGRDLPLPEPMPMLASRLATAYALDAEGRSEQAANIAQRLLEARPFLAPAWLLVSRDAERRKDYWKALAAYRQLLIWLPGMPALESRLADVAHAMGADDLAECNARRALAHFPDEGALHFRLATILSARGEAEPAIESCRRAIELGFEEARVWLSLGKLHLDRMEITRAIAAYQRALELDPNAAEAIGSFALSSLTGEDYGALRRLLERHAEAHPRNVDTLYALAVMSQRENQFDQAETLFERIVQAAPEHTQAHYNLAQVYLRQGRRDEGGAEMERFRELKAQEADAWERHNQAHLRRLEAQEAAAAGETERALAAYRQNIEEGTAELADYLAAGQACLTDGRSAEALAWFGRALKVSPFDRQALTGLADAAEAAGEEELLRATRQRLELLANPCTDSELR